MIMKALIPTAALGFALLLAGAAHSAEMLAAKNGMTLYTFDKDQGGMSSCYGECAKKWPPYFAKKGEKVMKDWTMVKRKDGKLQWAYDAKPLYFYAGDKAKGDKTGDGLGGVWHIVAE
jgi:predicted lipoprotein with Yx(FWY)xxD motif